MPEEKNTKANVCECQEEALKGRFRGAENALLTALNGWHGVRPSDEVITELRRNLMQARQACEDRGIKVETLWEFAQKRREIDEASVRRYADQQGLITPTVPHWLRQRIALIVGVIVSIAVVAVWTTIGGLIGALISGYIAFVLAEGGIAELFPTPAIRVARMASRLHVDVSDIWAKGSKDFNDYQRGYAANEWRKKNRGESTGWIKAR